MHENDKFETISDPQPPVLAEALHWLLNKMFEFLPFPADSIQQCESVSKRKQFVFSL